MLRAARVFVEYEPQTRVEGDLQHLDELSRALERIRLVRVPVQERFL